MADHVPLRDRGKPRLRLTRKGMNGMVEFIGPDDDLEVVFPNGDFIKLWVNSHGEMVVTSINGRLAVLPSASNSVHLTVVPMFEKTT